MPRQLDQASLDILRKISTRTVTKSLSGYVVCLAKEAPSQGTGNLSPSKRSAVSISPSPVGSPICCLSSAFVALEVRYSVRVCLVASLRRELRIKDSNLCKDVERKMVSKDRAGMGHCLRKIVFIHMMRYPRDLMKYVTNFVGNYEA
ncbi:hypothetical protein RHGRI_029215 [Rhododendron griersonianum]|uniref:Uncharacterized protein n=1 Tax=Rhododendron griersonianum TaxID=479676 RepID=A0AAV6IKP7_9ERIC|nr:hypothetical protein RHGRI_029215 [Rhododendron griersonianum]